MTIASYLIYIFSGILAWVIFYYVVKAASVYCLLSLLSVHFVKPAEAGHTIALYKVHDYFV